MATAPVKQRRAQGGRGGAGAGGGLDHQPAVVEPRQRRIMAAAAAARPATQKRAAAEVDDNSDNGSDYRQEDEPEDGETEEVRPKRQPKPTAKGAEMRQGRVTMGQAAVNKEAARRQRKEQASLGMLGETA